MYVVWCLFILCLQAFASQAADRPVTKVVYGLPAVHASDAEAIDRNLRLAGVDAVFVPADRDTIGFYRKKGYRVYLAFNAFGGKNGWKRHPDGVPVTADGVSMDRKAGLRGFGGVCPTHEAYRRERLLELSRWVSAFGGPDGIDGVFLDFIRYPGYWESPDPELIDSCYCDRCMRRFAEEAGVAVPALAPEERAGWIKAHGRKAWADWKVGVILSFIREARTLLEGNASGRKLDLGVFTVPYTAYEKQAALSTLLGQDVLQMASLVDVVSPMLYPGLMGKPAGWVGRMVSYWQEMLAAGTCALWPILQATDGSAEMFSRSLDEVQAAGGGTVSVYSFSGFDSAKWQALAAFKPLPDLIVNPQMAPSEAHFPDPFAWGKRPFGEDTNGLFVSRQKPFAALGLRPAIHFPIGWETTTAACIPGETYRFSALFLRSRFENGVYPELRLWGRDMLLNTHLLQGRFQPIAFDIRCPESGQEDEPILRWTNRHPSETFWMAKPSIRRVVPSGVEERPVSEPALLADGSFPIGVYGAEADDFPELKRIGVDAVFVSSGGSGKVDMVSRALAAGLQPIVVLPEDPVRMTDALEGLNQAHGGRQPAFYAADEPEIHGTSPRRLEEVYREIRERFPRSVVTMAVVRPQAVAEFRYAADLYLVDPYPVPSMPMIWLSDAIDEAAGAVGIGRVGAVVQAFGGPEHAAWGWPRMPSRAEMKGLTYLALVHGARAIFYYSWKEAARTEQGRADLAAVIEQLARLRPWFIRKPTTPAPLVRMTSAYGTDPSGRPAVHAACWVKDGKTMLVAVNTLGNHVAAEIFLPHIADRSSARFREMEAGGTFGVSHGRLEVTFKPHEVVVLVGSDG
uniref:Beta-galactosidase trimerisation domain-containing protein n=1 Tax=Desulfatirhabdium butyrativorans TaxID=340467 RepID=A0A7C4MPR7_9BACT